MKGHWKRIGGLAVALALLGGSAAAMNTPPAVAASLPVPGAGIAAPSIFRLQQPVMPGNNAQDTDVETNDDQESVADVEEPDGDVGEQEIGGDETHDATDCIQEGQFDGENAAC
jgi:hypothetical protein